MKLFIAALCVIAVTADRLENTYLPPNSANTAGGNGNFLNAPSNQYGAPAQRTGPATNYNAPNFGAGQSAEAGAATIKLINENNGDGSYNFEYETDNQIMHQESGELRNSGADEEGTLAVQGSYSYMGPDGVLYTVNYVADENGFRATGEHLPTPPPTPEAILKSLEQNVANQGYPSGQSNGYQQNNNGYQSNDNGYQSNNNGYQSNNNGYKINSNGYQQNNNGNQQNNGYQQNNNGNQQNNNVYQQKNNGQNNGYQQNNNVYQQKNYGQNNGYQQNNQAQIQASRQYLAPNKPSFNQKSGYQY